MVTLNTQTKEINCKIVYYGPGLGGKTTNLQIIHRKLPERNRTDMISLATESDRTLFFDFLPLDLGSIKGYNTKFQLYTVPGQVYYNETRKLVLRGVDGIVFVADSQKSVYKETVESFSNLRENLKVYGLDLQQIPHVIQYNKRDLPNILSLQELNGAINIHQAPYFEGIASQGVGVFDTLKAIGKLVIDHFNSKMRTGEDGSYKKKNTTAIPIINSSTPAPSVQNAPISPGSSNSQPELAGLSQSPPSPDREFRGQQNQENQNSTSPRSQPPLESTQPELHTPATAPGSWPAPSKTEQDSWRPVRPRNTQSIPVVKSDNQWSQANPSSPSLEAASSSRVVPPTQTGPALSPASASQKENMYAPEAGSGLNNPKSALSSHPLPAESRPPQAATSDAPISKKTDETGQKTTLFSDTKTLPIDDSILNFIAKRKGGQNSLSSNKSKGPTYQSLGAAPSEMPTSTPGVLASKDAGAAPFLNNPSAPENPQIIRSFSDSPPQQQNQFDRPSEIPSPENKKPQSQQPDSPFIDLQPFRGVD